MIFGNTFKEDLNAFLKNYALWICVGIVVLIAITILIIFVIKNRKGKTQSLPKGNEWVDALGGKENIAEVYAMGSRLNVTLKNNESVNRETLTALGVSNIMVMSNKMVLVIEDKAEKIASVISKAISE